MNFKSLFPILLFSLILNASEYSILLSPYHYISVSNQDGYHGLIGIGTAYQKNKNQFVLSYNYSGSIFGHGALATYDSVKGMNVFSISYRYRPQIKILGPISHNYGLVLSHRLVCKDYYDYSDTANGKIIYEAKKLTREIRSVHTFVGVHLGTELTVNRFTMEFGIDPGLIGSKVFLNNYFCNFYIKLF